MMVNWLMNTSSLVVDKWIPKKMLLINEYVVWTLDRTDNSHNDGEGVVNTVNVEGSSWWTTGKLEAWWTLRTMSRMTEPRIGQTVVTMMRNSCDDGEQRCLGNVNDDEQSCLNSEQGCLEDMGNNEQRCLEVVWDNEQRCLMVAGNSVQRYLVNVLDSDQRCLEVV